MPSNRIPGSIGKADSLEAAALYALNNRNLWQATPGATAFLQRVRNTYALALALLEAEKTKALPDMDRALKLIREGVFCPSHVHPSSQSLLLLAAQLGFRGHARQAAQLVRALGAAGARVTLDEGGLDELHRACYYGYGAEVVTALIEDCGGDALRPADNYSAGDAIPLAMAANQGNAAEMEAACVRPQAPRGRWLYGIQEGGCLCWTAWPQRFSPTPAWPAWRGGPSAPAA